MMFINRISPIANTRFSASPGNTTTISDWLGGKGLSRGDINYFESIKYTDNHPYLSRLGDILLTKLNDGSTIYKGKLSPNEFFEETKGCPLLTAVKIGYSDFHKIEVDGQNFFVEKKVYKRNEFWYRAIPYAVDPTTGTFAGFLPYGSWASAIRVTSERQHNPDNPYVNCSVTTKFTNGLDFQAYSTHRKDYDKLLSWFKGLEERGYL
jgi:hypothetical protein